jgi:hypothetical protein
MSPGQDPQELLRELQDLGREIDGIPVPIMDDALRDLGKAGLGRSPRIRDIPDLEQALEQGGDPHAQRLIQEILDNLRRQKQIIDGLS